MRFILDLRSSWGTLSLRKTDANAAAMAQIGRFISEAYVRRGRRRRSREPN